MSRTIRVTVMLLIATILVTACGSRHKGKAKEKSRVTQNAKQSPLPDMKARLLHVSDLPPGWSTDNSNDSKDGTASDCITKAKATFKPDAKANADFKKGNIPSFRTAVGHYATEAAASKNLHSVFDTYIKCGKFSFTSTFKKYSGNIEEMSFPQVGDELKAFTSSIDTEGVTIGFDVVLFRVKNAIGTIIYTDLGTPFIDDVQDVVKRANMKLQAMG